MEFLIFLVGAMSWALLILLSIKMLVFVSASLWHYWDNKNAKQHVGMHRPLVSVIVPAYNEEKVLDNCIQSLITQDCPACEILIIDDGSSDGTYAAGTVWAARYPNMIRAFTKPNGGKASALNFGIEKAAGEIIISMDADSLFIPNTIDELVIPFGDPTVGAVGGNVKVANRSSFFNGHQAMEYMMGLNLQRRAFALMGCMQVISGAIGAFRKDAMRTVGGYPEDTVVEDMDITITLVRAGYRVLYTGRAIAYTEAPEKLSDFMKQRQRWTYGGFQVLKKHRDMLFNPRYGKMGMVGLPYFLLFPWIDVIISLLFFSVIIRVVFLGGFETIFEFYVAMCVIQGALVVLALHMEKEDKRIALFTGLDSLWYNHCISLATVRSGIRFLHNTGEMEWNKLERLGKNQLPQN